jgi:hypothetical protein
VTIILKKGDAHNLQTVAVLTGGYRRARRSQLPIANTY